MATACCTPFGCTATQRARGPGQGPPPGPEGGEGAPRKRSNLQSRSLDAPQELAAAPSGPTAILRVQLDLLATAFGVTAV